MNNNDDSGRAAKKQKPGSAGGNNAPNSVDGMTEEFTLLFSPAKSDTFGEESDVESDDVDADEDYSPSPVDFDDPSTYTYILDADEEDEDSEIIEELIQSSPSSNLESSLDIDDGDSKKSANYEECVVNVDSTVFNCRGGEFKERYDALAKKKVDACSGLTKAIVGLVQYVENCDISQFSNKALEATFNKERDVIGHALNKACPNLAVNLGSKFSHHTSIVFYLHYAPNGCKLVYLWNYIADNQCCVHTMKFKLPNFLINEHEFGPDVMENWRFGGKTDLDEGSRMAVVDLIPILLEKKESDSEMREQYKEIADMLELDSYFDLMAISYCLIKMHSLLFQKVNGTVEKLQIHVASSATSWYVFGLKGISKYYRKVLGQTYCMTYGFHPQGWLMGIGKNEVVYPQSLLKIMARNLIGVYRSVSPQLNDMQESCIFAIFGCKQSSIDLKWYNVSAKALDVKGSLNLVAEIGANATVKEVRSHLTAKGVPSDVISIRKIRAGHRLHYVASLFPKDVSSLHGLSNELKCMIKATSSILNKTPDVLFQCLLKIARNQRRNSHMHQLAKLLDDCGDDDDDDGVHALVNCKEFQNYCRISGLDTEVVLQRVKDISLSYNKTFWRNYQQLVSYVETYPNDTVSVGDENIVTIDETINGGKYKYLSAWLKVMSGYSKKNHESENGYGYKAYQHMGSIEQKALEDKGVSFDPSMFSRAIEIRVRNNVSNRQDSNGRRAGTMDFEW
ncbi:hypothetical protein ACHAWT_005349 [Skeletonema menzelii]